MPCTFDGISGPAQSVIQNAFNQLIPLAQECAMALAPATFDEDEYVKWFDSKGDKNTVNVAHVRNIVNGISQALVSRNITFANATGGGVHQATQGLCAYVFTGGQFYQGHVGSGMRVLIIPKANQREMMKTIYHELSHKIGNTRDHSYNPIVCRGYALSQPQMAISNAENYDLFLEEFM